MKPIIFEKIIPNNVNENICQILAYQKWYLARDNPKENEFHLIRDFEKNRGFSLDCNGDPNDDPILHFFAHLVFSKVSEYMFDNKLIENTKGVKVDRVRYNLYLNNSYCKEHKDNPNDNYWSVVYDLHNSYSSTLVDGVKYQDKSGQAKIFKSNILHGATIDSRDNVRLNMNIIFEEYKK